MQCNNWDCYSITSSASAKKFTGSSMPVAFASGILVPFSDGLVGERSHLAGARCFYEVRWSGIAGAI
jgi:hypothetical protein